MKMYAIERSEVKPTWKMRLHSWLDMKTLKPQFSIEVREPDKKKWAHVYEAGDEWVKMFRTSVAAERFIKKLQQVAA